MENLVRQNDNSEAVPMCLREIKNMRAGRKSRRRGRKDKEKLRQKIDTSHNQMNEVYQEKRKKEDEVEIDPFLLKVMLQNRLPSLLRSLRSEQKSDERGRNQMTWWLLLLLSWSFLLRKRMLQQTKKKKWEKKLAF